MLQWPAPRPQSASSRRCLLLRRERLPEGPEWLYELKLDGYRALAIKTEGQVHLRSRNDNDFNAWYPSIVKALANLPDETVIDARLSRSMKGAILQQLAKLWLRERRRFELRGPMERRRGLWNRRGQYVNVHLCR